jgi:predicted NBD/HSP70 family sugar kinase
MDVAPMTAQTRKAKVVCGVDVGGKFTKVRVEAIDGRSGSSEVSTFKKSDEMPVGERVQGLVGSTFRAIMQAAKAGNIELREIDALGIGAPGARDPETRGFKMPNAIGRDEIGILQEVDFEGSLRQMLERNGFRKDAVLRGGNDCDVAAAARKFGRIVVLQDSRGKLGLMDETGTAVKVKRVFLLLGTGIGGGVLMPDGTVDEGATGAMELGHGGVATTWKSLECGCGKRNEGSVCIEAVASTTGQENITRILMQISYASRNMQKEKDVEDVFPWDDEARLLLRKTREWNDRKLETEVSGDEAGRLSNSIQAIDRLLEGSAGAGSLRDVVFDAGVIDELAVGNPPKVRIAAHAKFVAGQHFGRFLNDSIFPLHNPGELVIGGGGARTFLNGDEESNPFWRGMMSELRGRKKDPFGAIARCRIIAVVGDENLGIQGSMEFARTLYEKGGKP